jgi:hypothetical protein
MGGYATPIDCFHLREKTASTMEADPESKIVSPYGFRTLSISLDDHTMIFMLGHFYDFQYIASQSKLLPDHDVVQP